MIKSFKCKKFRTSVDKTSPTFEMGRTAPGVPLPLGIRWQGPTPFEDSELLYSVKGDDLKLTGDSKGALVFQGRNGDGSEVTKSFTFVGSSYPIQLNIAVRSAHATAPLPEGSLTDQREHTAPNHTTPLDAVS